MKILLLLSIVVLTWGSTTAKKLKCFPWTEESTTVTKTTTRCPRIKCESPYEWSDKFCKCVCPEIQCPVGYVPGNNCDCIWITTTTRTTTTTTTVCPNQVTCRNRNEWREDICECVCPPSYYCPVGTVRGGDCECLPDTTISSTDTTTEETASTSEQTTTEEITSTTGVTATDETTTEGTTLEQTTTEEITSTTDETTSTTDETTTDETTTTLEDTTTTPEDTTTTPDFTDTEPETTTPPSCDPCNCPKGNTVGSPIPCTCEPDQETLSTSSGHACCRTKKSLSSNTWPRKCDGRIINNANAYAFPCIASVEKSCGQCVKGNYQHYVNTTTNTEACCCDVTPT